METIKQVEQKLPKDQTTVWKIDAQHSTISFIARHMLITNVKGTFDSFDGEVTIVGDKLENAKAHAKIKAASINTGVGDRDTHLKSDDFFNAEQYPEISFESTGFEKIKEDHFEMKGNLSIREITKPVSFNVEFGGIIKDPYGNDRMGFSLEGTINRFDFNLKWNALLEAGGAVVGAQIRIFADVSLVREQA